MNRLAKPSKHTPFRDRQLSTEGSDGQPTYHKQREFRFINNENQDSSNPVMYAPRPIQRNQKEESPERGCRVRVQVGL